MNIKSFGKFIDTTSIKNVFVQGEKNADTVNFEVERYYNGSDISQLIFVIKGITERNHLAEQILEKSVRSDSIVLKWRVNSQFTAESGELKLEIRGITDLETDTDENVVIKYTMIPINISESSEENLPAPDIMQNMLDTLHVTENNIQNIYEKTCEVSVKTPYISDGVWWVYDSTDMKYVNTGVSAFDTSKIINYSVLDLPEINMTLINNTEFRYTNTRLTSLSISFNEDLADENFISSVVFKASESGVNLTMDFDFEYIHDVLFPEPLKQYCLMFFNDGFGIKCAWYGV